jgi:linoleate 10R-lipoxygenase
MRTLYLTYVSHNPVYDDLYHPLATYLGPKYSYRQDGSFNSLSDPEMGKAYQPYARSVQQKRALPQNMFPDAGLVFDTLLKREKEAPTHLSFPSRR